VRGRSAEVFFVKIRWCWS